MKTLTKTFLPTLKEDVSITPNSELEITKARSPVEIARRIVDLSNGRLRLSGKKRKSYRIQRQNSKVEVPSDELADIIKEAGASVIKIIPPGAPGSDSSKFNTYVMRHGEFEFFIVFGQGTNRGHDFETQTIEKLKASQKAAVKKNNKARGELHKILLNAFNIKTSDVAEIIHVGSKRVKRPILRGPTDVGEMISDLDFLLKNGRKIHISLKNREGKTLANSGYFSAFIPKLIRKNIIGFENGTHVLDEFIVDGCGVDKTKVVEGLNDYVQHKITNPPYRNVPVNYDEEIIKSYLASAYGYGYWYLRPKMASQGPGYQLINLASAEDAMEKVGDITSVIVNYPYWNPKSSSKQVTVKIYTTTAYYNVEIRNSQGKVHPNEIKVRLMKMFD